MVWYGILITIMFALICLVLILVILLQQGQSEGLAGTFGSGGMLGSAFGVHAKNRLAKFTTTAIIIFFLTIFLFAKFGKNFTTSETKSSLTQKLDDKSQKIKNDTDQDKEKINEQDELKPAGQPEPAEEEPGEKEKQSSENPEKKE